MTTERCLCESTEGDNSQCRLHPQDHGTGYGRSVSGFPREQQPQRSDIIEAGQVEGKFHSQFGIREQPPATDDFTRIAAVEAATKLVREWYGIPSDILIPDGCSGEVQGLFDKACDHFHAALSQSKLAPATDDKQWTPERIQSYQKNVLHWQIVMAKDINAALAAEQKHYDLNLAVWEKDNLALRQQLLSAQAMIAEALNELRKGFFEHRKEAMSIMESVDLSALDKYVAEKTNPLVDALAEEKK